MTFGWGQVDFEQGRSEAALFPGGVDCGTGSEVELHRLWRDMLRRRVFILKPTMLNPALVNPALGGVFSYLTPTLLHT